MNQIYFTTQKCTKKLKHLLFFTCDQRLIFLKIHIKFHSICAHLLIILIIMVLCSFINNLQLFMTIKLHLRTIVNHFPDKIIKIKQIKLISSTDKHTLHCWTTPSSKINQIFYNTKIHNNKTHFWRSPVDKLFLHAIRDSVIYKNPYKKIPLLCAFIQYFSSLLWFCAHLSNILQPFMRIKLK